MAIKRIKVAEGQEIVIDEWLHWPTFSTIEGAAGVNMDLRAFSYVVGQNVPQAGAVAGGTRTATPADTNQVRANASNHDEAFIIFSITYEHFALSDTTAYANPPVDLAATAPILSGTNLRILQRQMLVELVVGTGITKPQAAAPMSYFGQGIGAVAFGSGDALTIASGAATSLNLNYGTAGCINPTANQRSWQLPIYIHGDRSFYLRARSPEGAGVAGTGAMADINQDYRLKWYLDGLKRRPVA